MSPAVASSLGIVAYLALFTTVGLLFIFINLLVGRFLRPSNPNKEKLEIYECGEPTIGTSYVQFDLRFYVVALLFIIFDVEIAFFFPWATLYGKATHMMDRQAVVSYDSALGEIALTKHGKALYQEMGVRHPEVPQQVPASLMAGFKQEFGGQTSIDQIKERANYVSREGARQLVWIMVIDIAVFFAVLMIGFAYVWSRGDLNWVRAVSRERSEQRHNKSPPQGSPQESILSA